ncbi:MAG: OmpA family protein [Actinomycetia bacterium]|nr:OmpA family protein [Actinomycetes bacterium]
MSRSRRRRGGGGHGGGGGGGGGGHGGGDARWLVTYADLLTLLMVLFLVLWVISTIDLAKFEQFKDGLGDFGNPAAAETSPDAAPGGPSEIGLETQGGPATSTTTTTTTTTIPGAPTTTSPPGDGAGTTGEGAVLDAAQLEALQGDLQATIEAAGFGDVVTVDLQQRGLVISVRTDDVLFAAGAGYLEPAATRIVDVVAVELGLIGNPIIVEGYTDKRPLNAGNYDNWDLSVDRAVSVVKMLRDQYGIAPSRLAATGYGDQHPVATGDDEASYTRNRRVQIVIVAGPLADAEQPAVTVAP